MRSVLAVVAAILIFLFCWSLISGLLYGLGWAVLRAGHEPGIFIYIHVLLMWILSPGLGAAVGVYSASSAFRDVPPATIFVSFVSVWTVVLLVLLLFGLVSWSSGRSSGGDLFLLFAQATAIIAGARFGRMYTEK